MLTHDDAPGAALSKKHDHAKKLEEVAELKRQITSLTQNEKSDKKIVDSTSCSMRPKEASSGTVLS